MPVRARLAAEGHEQLVGLDRSSRRRARSRRRRRARPAVAETPRRTSTPSSRSDSSTCSLANGSSRSISRSPRCTSVTFDPSAPQACDISTADDAAAEDREARRHGARAVVALRLVQGFASRRPGMSGTRGVEPVATTTARARRQRVLSRRRRPAASRRSALARGRARRRAARATAPGCCRRGRGSPRRGARARAAESMRPETCEPGHAPHLVGELHRAQQRLRRHAGVEGAVAADERLPRRSPRTGRAHPACRPPPRRQGRRRSPRRRIRACAACRRMRAGGVTSQPSPRGGTPGP